MKSLKSLADATRAAAELGASVSVGGRVINASGARMSLARTSPQPAPAPQPTAPDPMDRVTELMSLQAKLMAAQGQAMGDVLVKMIEHLERPALTTAPAAVTTAAPSMRPIRFDVVRSGESVSLVPTYGGGTPAMPTSFDLARDPKGRLLAVTPIYH